MIRTTNIKEGRIDLSTCRYVEEDTYDRWTRRAKVLNGDVILTREAPIGEVGYVHGLGEVFLGQRLMQYRPDPGKIVPRYLFYAFRSPDLQHQFGTHDGSGSVVSHIRVADCHEFKVSVPPLAEQARVAELLGSLDDKIELNRRTNETLEAMAQAIFRDWFVDFGPTRRKINGASDPLIILGGVVSDRARAQELADLFPDRFGDNGLPEGWSRASLGDLVENVVERCVAGQVTQNRPYVPIDTITARTLIIQESRPGSEAKSSLVTFRRNDILFGAMRPYFHKVALAHSEGTTRTTVFVLRPKVKTDLAFALMTINDEATIEYATQHSSGTTIPYAVWRQSLERMLVTLPAPAVRAGYGTLVRPMIDRMLASPAQNRSLVATRDLLLPKLMSGEISLGDAENLAEDAA